MKFRLKYKYSPPANKLESLFKANTEQAKNGMEINAACLMDLDCMLMFTIFMPFKYAFTSCATLLYTNRETGSKALNCY